MEELWRRIVFFICVSNSDDHLRNHGFLLESAGWVLSPAYDINPVPYGEGLSLNISEGDNAQDLDLAREVAVYFRIKAARAEVIIGEIVTVVKTWRKVARQFGISKLEQERMAPAFRIADGA
jgi:serine/threonine-protein kinase HipA